VKPLLAISIGDPAGIGPEIVMAAAHDARVKRACALVLYGDPEALAAGARARSLPASGKSAVSRIEPVRVVQPDSRVKLRRKSTAERSKTKWNPGPASGEAAFRFLDAAARATKAGEHDALVTAPINKYWMARAGHEYDGHTGYLSELTGKHATMMLAGRRLRVVLATTHLAIADVPRALTAAAISEAGRTTAAHLRAFHGIARARIAVAALNPHAGENGLFGDEEKRVIEPAVRALKRARVNVEGPFPADTLFAAAASGDYDAVLCMYHDQALIPLKLLEFGRAVNVSMGLPFIRTSPDHGTAYDLAGTGRARADSMIEAILVAAAMVGNRRRKSS
jgi:4-hydroxythreonine-4-phosphate dehydrogenase